MSICRWAAAGAGVLSVWLAAGPAVPAEEVNVSGLVPALSVPRMSKPPVLDGAIDPAEWAEAAAVSGVENQENKQLVVRPTTFYLAWDPDHLYLACRAWVMPGCIPFVSGRVPGSPNVGDVGLELHFKPVGKMTAGSTDSSYKFVVNALGMYGDCVRVSVGQLFRTWNPKFRVAVRQTAPGTAPRGGSWLEWEMSATPQDFEVAGPNRAGDQWQMMLGFNQLPGWCQARIPSTSGYFDPSGYPLITLVENTAAVQVTMDEMPGVLDGVAAVTFRAYNPTAKPAALAALAQIKDAQGDLVTKTQTLTVEPGKTAEWALNEKFPRETKGGTVFYRVTQGDRPLFCYGTSFTVGYGESWVQAVPLAPNTFPLSATFNPVRCNFQVQADVYQLSNRDQAKTLRYRILKDGEPRPVLERSLDGMEIADLRKYDLLPPLNLAGKEQYRVRPRK